MRRLLLQGRPGRGHPVHQEVALLELGEQRLAELRHDREPGDDDHADRERTRVAVVRTMRLSRRVAVAAAAARSATRGARCGAFRSRISASAGVTVSATTSEASTARPYEIDQRPEERAGQPAR